MWLLVELGCVGSVGTLNPGSPEGCFVTVCGGLLQYPVGGFRCLTRKASAMGCCLWLPVLALVLVVLLLVLLTQALRAIFYI